MSSRHNLFCLCCGEHLEWKEESDQREHDHAVKEPEKEGAEARVPEPGPDDVPCGDHDEDDCEDDDGQSVKETAHKVPVKPVLCVDKDKHPTDDDAVTHCQGRSGHYQLMME